MDNRPVGVYDSGLGGLTVWREIRRQLPEPIFNLWKAPCEWGPPKNI